MSAGNFAPCPTNQDSFHMFSLTPCPCFNTEFINNDPVCSPLIPQNLLRLVSQVWAWPGWP